MSGSLRHYFCLLKACRVYSVYTKNTVERRLRLFELNVPYKYLRYRPNGNTSYYKNMMLHGYIEAYINISNTPISIGGKLL